MESKKQEIEKVRKILGNEFDTVIPDESIELMIYSFKLMARILIQENKREDG